MSFRVCLISGDECKKRWKYIRDSYNRFRRKNKVGTGSAAQSKNSKNQLYERLNFLKVSAEAEGIKNILSPSSETQPSDLSQDDNTQEATAITPTREENTNSNFLQSAVDTQKTSQSKTKRKQQDEFLGYLKKRAASKVHSAKRSFDE